MNETMPALYAPSTMLAEHGFACSMQSAAEALERHGLYLSLHDRETLQEQRTLALEETERVELETGALTVVVEELAASPFLSQAGLVDTLVQAQHAFYLLRDEIPVDIPDEELACALRTWFDRLEGDLEELEALSPQEVMAASPEAARNAVESAYSEAYFEVLPELRSKTYSETYSETPVKEPAEASPEGTYRIYDEDGREYTWDPHAWDYDEFADGWDGERWSDDFE